MAQSIIPQNTAISGALTSPTSGITTNGRWFYDPNSSTVRVYLYARSSSNITASMTLATIPSEYRPSSNWALFGFMTSGGSGVAYSGRVDTNGNITQQLGSQCREVFLCGEYAI